LSKISGLLIRFNSPHHFIILSFWFVTAPVIFRTASGEYGRHSPHKQRKEPQMVGSIVSGVAELLFESGHFFRDKSSFDRRFRGPGGDSWPFFQRSPVQCRGQPLHGDLPVAVLRPRLGCLYDDACREVSYPHSRVCSVAMLSARTRGAEIIDRDVGLFNFDAHKASFVQPRKLKVQGE
jgi:hypothetical protein